MTVGERVRLETGPSITWSRDPVTGGFLMTVPDGWAGGTVTLGSIEALFTAAGQLFAGTGTNTGELLSAGATGQLLSVGGSDPSGLQWVNPEGLVAVKTSNYNPVAADAGKTIVYNGSSLTAALPGTAPAAPWFVTLINVAATPVTVTSTPNINEQALGGSITVYLMPGRSVTIWSDASQYWCSRQGLLATQQWNGTAGTQSQTTTTWTAPSWLTMLAVGIAIGAGGAGGGAAVAGGAGAGAGGNCAISRDVPIYPSHAYTVVAPGGPPGGAGAGLGGLYAGLTDGANQYVFYARGGNGGPASNGATPTGGAPGYQGTDLFNNYDISGASGGNGTASGGVGAAGGGAAGDALAASGVTGGSGILLTGGNGAAATSGGGVSHGGNNASTPGGGGGGANKNGASVNGGNGGFGTVLLGWWI